MVNTEEDISKLSRQDNVGGGDAAHYRCQLTNTCEDQAAHETQGGREIRGKVREGEKGLAANINENLKKSVGV